MTEQTPQPTTKKKHTGRSIGNTRREAETAELGKGPETVAMELGF